MDIDYTRYTDAQLEVAARYSDEAAAVLAVRQDAGESDGSKERVAGLLATNTAATRAAGRRALRSQR